MEILSYRKPLLAGVMVAALSGAVSSVAQTPVDAVTTAGTQRIEENAEAQEAVDILSDAVSDLAAEYKQLSKVVEGLEVYNGLLQKQVDNQNAEINALNDSIGKVALIERQIVPLMVQMVETLDAFVALDVPFLLEERSGRVARLRAMMERSDVTAAEKFRRILEAYEIENDYGRTIEAYKGSLDLDGAKREVNFLRVGRVALLYQNDGGELTGAWDTASRSWQTLAPETYQREVAAGLKIARKQTAPDLLVLPVAAPNGGVQ